jgi:hypothetical protein
VIRTAIGVVARLVAAGIIIAIALVGVLVTAGVTSLADIPGQLQLQAFSWLTDLRLGAAYFLLGCLGALTAVSFLAFAPSLGSRLEQMQIQADLDELHQQQELIVQMRLAVMRDRAELTRDQMRLIVGLNMLSDDIDSLVRDLRSRTRAETQWLLVLSLPTILIGGALAAAVTGLTVIGRSLLPGALLLQSVFLGFMWTGIATAIDVIRTALLRAYVAQPAASRPLAEQVAGLDIRVRSDLAAIRQTLVEARRVEDGHFADFGERLAKLEEAVNRLEPPLDDLQALPGLTADHARLLGQARISSQADLLQHAATPDARRTLEIRTGLAQPRLLLWHNRAELLQIEGLDAEQAELLKHAGVDTLRELTQRNPDHLQVRLAEVNASDHLVASDPMLDQVIAWVEAAKRLLPEKPGD